MENIIIVAIFVVIVAIAARSTIKHFKGDGGCCGGGGYKVKKKKLSNVKYKKTFQVDGMHCENCKSRVEETIGDIKGVAGVVDLKKGSLTVSYEEEVSDEIIKAKLERLGYQVSEGHSIAS